MKMHLDPAVYENIIRMNEHLKHQLEIAQRVDGAFWMAEAIRMRTELSSIEVEVQRGGFGMKERIADHVKRGLTPTPPPARKAAH